VQILLFTAVLAANTGLDAFMRYLAFLPIVRRPLKTLTDLQRRHFQSLLDPSLRKPLSRRRHSYLCAPLPRAAHFRDGDTSIQMASSLCQQYGGTGGVCGRAADSRWMAGELQTEDGGAKRERADQSAFQTIMQGRGEETVVELEGLAGVAAAAVSYAELACSPLSAHRASS